MSITTRPVAVVTGGTRGLGAAITARLARDGAHVIATYRRDDDAASALVRQVAQAGGSVEARRVDSAEPAQLKALFADIEATHGRPDVLVNNAGINRDAPFLDLSLDDFDAVLATGLRGAFVATGHAARLMLRHDGGSIVNIGATTGVTGRKDGVNYCAAKAGLMVMTRCLALELAPRVRVNTVVPGLMLTDETAHRRGLADPRIAAERAAGIPLQRLGTPEDVAAAVAFLCGPDAAYITGQALPVTGGLYLNHG